MRHRFTALSAAAFLATTACGEFVQPSASTPTVDAASFSTGVAANGEYVVLARQSGLKADFEEQVAALGGSIVFVHRPSGFAFVSGLGPDAAVQIGGRADVARIEQDATFAIRTLGSAEADAVAVSDGIESVANPATASRFPWQWNMQLIGAPAAWAAGHLGDPSVTVAILDTGIDYDAPDLNGLVDLSRSISFIKSDNDSIAPYFPSRHKINDYHGHGTNVATQVSSRAIATAGVTSKTTLIGVKVLSSRGSGSLGAVLSGVLHAADQGADIANMSLGGGFSKAGNGRYVSLINSVFNYAKQQGMLIVVAAGNDEMDMDANGNMLKSYCDATHVVCVSSVGPETATANPEQFSRFSNFGENIDLAGPGGNYLADESTTSWIWGPGTASWVWSYCAKYRIVYDEAGTMFLTNCTAGNRLRGMVGTSQAAPHVAGVAALLVTRIGKDNPAQLKAALLNSGQDLGAAGVDPYFGNGRISVPKALGL